MLASEDGSYFNLLFLRATLNGLSHLLLCRSNNFTFISPYCFLLLFTAFTLLIQRPLRTHSPLFNGTNLG
jgi:hypothetical protein